MAERSVNNSARSPFGVLTVVTVIFHQCMNDELLFVLISSSDLPVMTVSFVSGLRVTFSELSLLCFAALTETL